ncbi:hypothetical protein GYMLUDRAFT_231584 [Collybiopsis luxurians FD-317 M1]|uniref:Unplaced genomic scaffold GYMLUscaffold_64, whole genome shotgun sequence n=1 Tax=Collybiopsis luxurians FD-317 M1 TaxID=944289 RepID=A0A0D0AWA1_9AGAR|nr:hypothetical protein GYMLUDRAFT_231584 [Collybiopsis luxurians FD-317 M1]
MYYEADTYPTPGFPTENPCLSFWLQNTRSSPLLSHRTTDLPPETATIDVAIIGSGLSGAATAYYLFSRGKNSSTLPPQSVLMLEARGACEGATGRNGGHCRPFVFQGYSEYKKIFGKEQALKIIAHDMENLHLMEHLIKEEEIDCDFWLGESFDTCLDQEAATNRLKSYEEFKADGGPLDGIVELIMDSEKAKQLTRMREAVITASFPAASLFPYKLVSHLLQICISKYGLNLQTHTPVTSVTASASEEGSKWILTTPRGRVTARQVIVPGQGQCAAIVPTKSYSGNGMMEKTCTYSWGKGNYDYLIQRPKDGVIILGGGKESAPSAIYGCTNDSGRVEDGGKQQAITEYLKRAMENYFQDWTGSNQHKGRECVGEGFLYDWTGIMGYTRDNIPFVGNVEGKPGAYIIAGHCGHGMARIISCAKSLATLISGGSWTDTTLPESFRPSKERLIRRKKATSTVHGNAE